MHLRWESRTSLSIDSQMALPPLMGLYKNSLNYIFFNFFGVSKLEWNFYIFVLGIFAASFKFSEACLSAAKRISVFPFSALALKSVLAAIKIFKVSEFPLSAAKWIGVFLYLSLALM